MRLNGWNIVFSIGLYLSSNYPTLKTSSLNSSMAENWFELTMLILKLKSESRLLMIDFLFAITCTSKCRPTGVDSQQSSFAT